MFQIDAVQFSLVVVQRQCKHMNPEFQIVLLSVIERNYDNLKFASWNFTCKSKTTQNCWRSQKRENWGKKSLTRTTSDENITLSLLMLRIPPDRSFDADSSIISLHCNWVAVALVNPGSKHQNLNFVLQKHEFNQQPITQRYLYNKWITKHIWPPPFSSTHNDIMVIFCLWNESVNRIAKGTTKSELIIFLRAKVY